MKLPLKILTAVRSHIETWGRAESHGVTSRVIRPRRLYRYIFTVRGGRHEFIGWRVFLRARNKQTVALDIMHDGGYRFYVGAAVSDWLRRAQGAERRKHVEGYEARILTVPAIHRTFLWFTSSHASKPDLFEDLDRRSEGKSQWITKREVDELARASIAAASRMWRVAKKGTPTQRGGANKGLAQ